MLRIAVNLWVEERPQRFMGLDLGARMTVMQLQDGGMFVHSPVQLDDGLRKELDKLGPRANP